MREAVTVSQLNRYIKELFSDNNILRNVMVKGEVSNLKESRGNYYFSLKDEQAAIQCIVFTNYSGASVDLSNISDGAQIIVYGKVAVYEKGGTYAIYVSKVENSGLGEYFIKLEELKKKLSELGMFDESYKKEIPKYSRNIGVVTAENGATKTWTVTLAIAAEGETASSEKELVSISAAGQIEAATINASNKTVVLHLPNASALSAVQLTIAVSDKASHNFSSASIDLRQPRELIIHAQDMSSVTWTISADYPLSAEADIESFETEDFSSEVQIDKSNKKVALSVPFGTDLSEVYFSATVSQGASITSPKYGYLDLSSKSAEMVITAANGSTAKWTVTATEVVPAPQINSIAIGNGKVAGTIDQSKGTIFFNMSYDKDLNLRSLIVKTLSLSDGATTSDIAQGSNYDFAMPKTVTVSNSAGASKVYTLQAGYQYPNSNFNSWKKDKFDNYNAVDGWDNGNNDFASTLTVNQEGQVIKMETQKVAGKIASGNMLIAKFNPKNVAPANMASYDDGNELIDFGKPFYGRPKYVEFDVKYEGQGDSCDLYLMLESRLDKDGNIRTANNGSNVGRVSSDVNTLVASAWYRAKNVTSEDDPDVVSISDASRSGYKTIRLAIHYGPPLTGSPIYASRAFATSLMDNDGIDNHVVETGTPDQFPVTHIRVVMASSAMGNEYTGVVGATLLVDEMRLIY